MPRSPAKADWTLTGPRLVLLDPPDYHKVGLLQPSAVAPLLREYCGANARIPENAQVEALNARLRALHRDGFYFGANIYSYYTAARFRVADIRLRYFLEPSYRRLYNWWAAVVQWVLDRYPTFCERFLAYLVGGIDEMEVTLVALKDGDPPSPSPAAPR